MIAVIVAAVVADDIVVAILLSDPVSLMHVISSSKLKIKNSFCKMACQQFGMFIASDAARISSIGER